MISIQKQNILNNKTIFILLTLFTVIVYHGAIHHEFILYDDQVYLNAITNNDKGFWHLFSWAFTSTVNANWHPLTLISLAIDYKIYGLNAGGFHITSVILHLFNAFLIFLISRLLLKNSVQGFLIATIFLVHPVNVEAVAWIAERKGVLGAFFALLTIYFYLLYAAKTSWRYFFASMLFFLASLMSKAVFVTLPLLLVVIDIYINTIDGKSLGLLFIRRSILRQTPLLFISLIIGFVTIHAHGSTDALGVNELFTVWTRISKAIAFFPVYLGQLFYPVELAIPYPYRIPTTLEITSGLFILLSISILAIMYRRRTPLLFLGWFWYLLLLLPVSGLLQSGYFSHADRYAYLPLVGVIIFTTGFISLVTARYGFKKTTTVGLAVVIILITGTLAWVQHRNWQNTITLFHNTYSIDKENYLANTYLSSFYVLAGQYDEGMKFYRQARGSAPLYMELYDKTADSLLKAGENKLAESVMNDARTVILHIHNDSATRHSKSKFLKLTEKHYTKHVGYFIGRKEFDTALKIAKEGLEVLPLNLKLLFLHAYTNLAIGNVELAEAELQRIIKTTPAQFQAYSVLIQLYVSQQRLKEAEQLYLIARKQFPAKSDELASFLKLPENKK